MGRDPGTHARLVAGVVTAGLLLPAVVVAAAPDPAVHPDGAVSPVLIEAVDVDRVNLLLASLVVPWPVLVVLQLNRGEPAPAGPVAVGVRVLVGPVDALFAFAGTFGLADAAAYGMSRVAEPRTDGGSADG